MGDEKFITIQEFAERLSITVYKAMQLARAGEIPGAIFIDDADKCRVPESSVGKVGQAVKKEAGETGGTNLNPKVTKLKEEIEIAKLQTELDLEMRKFASFAEFDRAKEDWGKAKAEIEKNFETTKTELSAKTESLAKWESSLDSMQKSLEERDEAVEAGERNLAKEVEKEKVTILSRQNRIGEAEVAHQKKMKDEDEKRQARNLMLLSGVDTLASAIYNPPPQSINNLLQERLISQLTPIMEHFGLKPVFDELNRYVPFGERNLLGINIKESGRDLPFTPSDGELPANIRACFKVTVKVFNFLNKEPQLGRDFCTRMKATALKLQELVRGKSDDELIASKERILVFFNAFHKNMTLLAGNYQEAKGDFQAESDWLHSQAIFLEKKIGVGVYQDAFLPLAHPKRKNNR
jgi:hypothetical protein